MHATGGMSLIHRFMPRYSLRQLDRVAVAASAEEAWTAVRALRRAAPLPPSAGFDDITAGAGFHLLAEAPGREIVVGSIGRFWQPVIAFADITPAQFHDFDDPGYGKLAWCVQVDPREGGGSFITIDLRVDATDPESLARFERYWWLIGAFSHAIRRAWLHRLARDLGAARSHDALAGDEILGAPRFQKTHTVDIEARPAEVWPWLVQMGCGRGGWYSFDTLDNGGIHSAERIVPELQRLAVGDLIPATPHGPERLAVLRVQPQRALVLGSPSLVGSAMKEPPWRMTWAFVLEPIGTEATRLTVRVRAQYAATTTMKVLRPVMATLHEVMERRQLANLRRRSEAALH
jgi:hypothetical protein